MYIYIYIRGLGPCRCGRRRRARAAAAAAAARAAAAAAATQASAHRWLKAQGRKPTESNYTCTRLSNSDSRRDIYIISTLLAKAKHKPNVTST